MSFLVVLLLVDLPDVDTSAADLYLEAARTWTSLDKTVNAGQRGVHAYLALNDHRLDDPDLSAYFQDMGPLLDLLKRAARPDKCRFSGKELPARLDDARFEFQNLIHSRARYRIATAQPALAVEDASLLRRVSEHLAPPGLIGLGVRRSGHKLAVAVTRDAVLSADRELLEFVIAGFEQEPAFRFDFADVVHDERILIAQFREETERLLALHDARSAMPAVEAAMEAVCVGYFDSMERELAGRRLLQAKLVTMGKIAEEYGPPPGGAAKFEEVMLELLDGSPEKLNAAVFEGVFRTIVGLMSRTNDSMFRMSARHQVEDQLVRLAARVRHHELVHGDVPASLDALGLPPELATDPVNGKPMGYRRTSTSFVISSVGLPDDDSSDAWTIEVPRHR